MSDVDTKVLARIKKLYDKAENLKAMGNEAEAAAFMEGVQKTLAKYQLDMSIVESSLLDIEDPLERTYVRPVRADGTSSRGVIPLRWARMLANAIAYAHFCEILVSNRSDAIWFVGRKSNRQVAVYLYQVLTRTACELADEATAREADDREILYGHRRTGEFRLAWLTGFASRLGRRLYDLRDAQQEGGMKLVWVRSDEELKKFVADLGLGEAKTGHGAYGAGYAAGQKAAEKVNLNRPLDSTGQEAKRLA